MNLLDIDENSKRLDYPMSSSTNLKVAIPNPNNESILPVTGKLRYPSDRARPDILTSVGKISSDTQPYPSDDHYNSAKQILRYLKSTDKLSVVLGGNSLEIFAFSDSNYEKTGNCLSRLGGVIFMGYDSGAIYNESKSDTVVSHSSAEAELDRIIRVIVYLKEIANWMGLNIKDPIPIYEDSKSIKDVAESMKQSNNLRHVNICVNYVRQMVNNRTVKLMSIKSEFNVADLHTKCLSGQIFKNHRNKIIYGFGGNANNIHQFMDEYI